MIDIEQLYIDLIFRASKKYANWDPEAPVRVGDYGYISEGKVHRFDFFVFWKVTKGRFVKEGNIYDDGYAKMYNIPQPVVHNKRLSMVQKVDGSTGSGTGVTSGGLMWVTSKNVRGLASDVGAGGGLEGVATANIKAAFEFTSGKGAVLAMEDEETAFIDLPGRLLNLLESKELLGRVVVSEVHRCSSYARYLASEGAKMLNIGLGADVPIPAAPGVSASVSVENKWTCDQLVGNFKAKVGTKGRRDFYPLFRLVSIKERGPTSGLARSRSRGGSMDGQSLPEIDLPWEAVEDEEIDDFADVGAQGSVRWI